MALDNAAFVDLRNYIRRRVHNLKYRIGSSIYTVDISDAEELSNGVVRIKAPIIPSGAGRITRVELYNNNGEIWAHQDCDITIEQGQTGVLYWFDFTVKEGKPDA